MKLIKIESFMSNPFQSTCWAQAKAFNGWKAHYFSIEEITKPFKLLVLTRGFIHNLFKIAYVPMGPELSIFEQEGLIEDLSKQLTKILSKRVVFIRFDFPFDYANHFSWLNKPLNEINQYFIQLCKKEGLYLNQESIQPQGTVVIDLEKDLDYKQRAKRIINKNKDLVSVSYWNHTQDEFDKWYEIYLVTAKRDGFTPRNKDYIRHFLDNKEYATLILAKVNDEIQGGLVLLRSKSIQLYLYGASQRSYDFNVSYVMQDFAIKEGKRRGLKYYDLYGVGSSFNQNDHLKSLTLFKTSFGGDVIYRIPTSDYPINASLYLLYRFAEHIRIKFFRKKS